jgi:hypothetical protein
MISDNLLWSAGKLERGGTSKPSIHFHQGLTLNGKASIFVEILAGEQVIGGPF